MDDNMLLLEEALSLPAVQVYLNLVIMDRAYGGPEEGGWWYNTYTPVVSLPLPVVTPEQQDLVVVFYNAMEKLVEELNRGRRPIDSVLSQGVYTFFLSKRPAENEPKTPPHYE